MKISERARSTIQPVHSDKDRACPLCKHVKPNPRSLEDHRRFFAVLNAAYEHWPDRPGLFRPASVDHLRYWLIVEAGYYDATTIEVAWDRQPAQSCLVDVITAAIAAGHGRGFVYVEGGRIEVRAPKSISFKSLSQRKFGEIRSAVEDVIMAKSGLNPDQLLREKSA